MICGLLTPDGGSGTCLGFDIIRESRRIKHQVGYMTQQFSLYEDLTIAREPGLRGAPLRPRPARASASTERSTARPDLAARPAGRHAVRRLEAAAGAGRLRSCTSPSCCCSTSRPPASTPRRGATSGTRSTARRAGPDRAGLDPLHGRGRALPRHRLHRLRQADGARHGRGGGRAARVSSPSMATGPGATSWRRDAPAQPASTRCAPFGATLHVVRLRRGGARGGPIEPLRKAPTQLGARPSPRSRTCSST